MGEVIVRTKDELEKAVQAKEKRIIVKGELAEKLNTALKIKMASKWTIGLLSAALATIPITGGLSIVGAAGIASLTGLEIALIIAVASLGITLVLLTGKEYRKVYFKAKDENGNREAILELERSS